MGAKSTTAPVTDEAVEVVLGALVVRLVISDDAPVRLLSIVPAGRPIAADDVAAPRPRVTPLVELSLAGESHVRHSHDVRHRNYAASHRLRYVDHRVDASELVVRQRDPETGALVTSRLRSITPDSVSATTRIENGGGTDLTVEYLSSLVLSGFAEVVAADIFERLRVHDARMSWTGEYRWSDRSLTDVGIVDVGIPHATSSSRTSHSVGASGSWSTSTHLPQGALEDRETGLIWAWQIEHNGPWYAELDDVGRDAAIALSGPTYRQHHWAETLAPGEVFESVPASVAVVHGTLDTALAAVTRHRRSIRRSTSVGLPIIANDYMNCLMGDPSTEKLLPIIEAAAAVGAQYFVIDAGWYADDNGWWSTVGAWTESQVRFPGGLSEVLDRIRSLGMTPGLWLEPEVMGVDSDALAELPDEAFFHRSGRRVAEQGRYHLDFRHPAVRRRMDDLVDRLVSDYGVGYLKLDYNINVGEGTDVGPSGIGTGSLGAGLLGHDRAYVAWLDGIRERHPRLLLENCASGGMRADPAQLAATHLQSTSDQEDPVLNAAIAVAAPSAMPPEQAGVWSYPQPHYSDDLNDFTMAQSTLSRVHLGGRVDLLDPRQRDRVRSALAVHAGLAEFMPVAEPFWPLGLPGWSDEHLALGLRSESRQVVAVFRRGGSETIELPLEGRARDARVLFPTDRAVQLEPTPSGVRVTIPADPGSCIFEVVSRD
ncbi:glycoside hydrolase family 36 protein [Frondihabitans cladoniiphilus]|uniref:Alpha-galactosidase n=1 Tax=Frondihabitans cladoniiphilus TaxID=715785 RepID=A0ABP8W6J5_9MICO